MLHLRRLRPLVVILAVMIVTAWAAVDATRFGRPLPDLAASCGTANPYLVTTCFRGILRSQQAEPFSLLAPSVVLFHESPFDFPHFQLASFAQTGSVWGLAFRKRDHSVYAAAFHKRQLPYGPGGPGGIYRISLVDGAVSLFATVPDVGGNRHEAYPQRNLDAVAMYGAGRASLGDLDISEDEKWLFVVNLASRRVYRYDLESGQPAGQFNHGAINEPWVQEARPFGLAVKGDFVYHGVVRSAELGGRRQDLAAYVYRSHLDGTAMQQVAAFSLDYPRGFLSTQYALANNRLDWQPWTDDTSWWTFSGPLVHPMPILADIEIDAGGHMILGFRRRSHYISAGLLEISTYALGSRSSYPMRKPQSLSKRSLAKCE